MKASDMLLMIDNEIRLTAKRCADRFCSSRRWNRCAKSPSGWRKCSDMEKVIVGIAEGRAVHAGQTLISYALGSCGGNLFV